MPRQRVESSFPEAAGLLNPAGRFIEWSRSETKAMDPTVDLPLDEAGVLENAKVPGDRRRRDGVGPGKLAYGSLFLPGQVLENSSARRISKRMEDLIEPWQTVNHMVNSMQEAPGTSTES